MTTVDRLYKKGLLDRVAEGRAFRYTPRQTSEEMQRVTALESIRQLLTGGTPSPLPLSYLVEALSDHDAQLLDELQLLVERKRRELRERKTNKGHETKEDEDGARTKLMFALRGIAVSLTFFVLSCTVSCRHSWRSFGDLAAPAPYPRKDVSRPALPAASSSPGNLSRHNPVFVVPSFQILEPRAADEGMGIDSAGLGPLRPGMTCMWMLSCDRRSSEDVASGITLA